MFDNDNAQLKMKIYPLTQRVHTDLHIPHPHG